MKLIIYVLLVFLLFINFLQADEAPTYVELKEYKGYVRTIFFFPDGKKIITSGDDRFTRIWEVETGKELYKLQGTFFRTTSDMKKIVTQNRDGAEGTFHIWDTESGKELMKVPVWDWSMFGFSSDKKKVFIGRYVLGEGRNEIQIWNIESGQKWLKLDNGQIYSLPDGKRMAMVSLNGVQIWDADSGKELLKIEGGFANVHPVSGNFSPDGKKFATRDQTGINTIRDIESGKELLKVEGIFHGFSSDGKKVFTYTLDNAVNDWTTHVWDIESGKELHKLEGSLCGGFSPDGKIIVTKKTGHDMRMWDVDSGRELHKLQGQYAWGFTPDGKKFITGFEGSVPGNGDTSMWDVETGKAMQLRGVFSRFSDDGKKVITDTENPEDDGFSRLEFLWDIETGWELTQETQEWRGMTVAFSPDGKIVTYSMNKTKSFYFLSSTKGTKNTKFSLFSCFSCLSWRKIMPKQFEIRSNLSTP